MRQIQDEYYKVNDESQKETKPKIIKNDSESPAGQKLLSPSNILPPSPMDMISMPSPEANLLVEDSSITVHVNSDIVPTTLPVEKTVPSTKIINH